MMKNLARTLVTLVFLFAYPLSTWAGDTIDDVSALVGDVNGANAGVELIVPSMAYSRTGLDFSFMVLRPSVGATVGASLYRTGVKTLTKPVVTCTAQNWDDSEENWKYLRFGTFMVAGVTLIEECEGGEGYRSSSKSYVYIVDASRSGRTPVLLTYGGQEMKGLSLVDDFNNAGSSSDLMIALMNPATGRASIVLRDFISGGNYSSNTIQSVTE